MTPASEANCEQLTYNAVIRKIFTRITEFPPTRRSVDTLRKEVKHVLVEISVPAFFWSGKYGLLDEVRPTAAYNTSSELNYRKPDDEEPDPTPRASTNQIVNQKKKKDSSLDWPPYLVVHKIRSMLGGMFQHPRRPPSGLLRATK